MLKPRIGVARLEADDRAGGIGEVVVEHAAKGGVRKSERPADAARPRRRARIERAVRAAGGNVGLVESLEDVIRRVWRVEVVALIERRASSSLVPLLPT